MFAALLFLAGLAAPLGAWSQPNDDDLSAQRRIEAAYLYKFGSYITWGTDAFPNPDSPFIIGVAGDDGMADELAKLVSDRPLNGHVVEVRKLRGGQATAGIQLLFVAAGTPQGQTLIDSARGDFTVAITEGEDGLERGADMSFVLVNDRVRFDITLDTTHLKGVKISSQLLSVADKVEGGKP
jgi:hypothetical protein